MRLILKTIIFFLIINIFYGCINPPVGKFVLFNNKILPGYKRLPVIWNYERHSNGSIYFERYFIDDLDLLFAGDIVSSQEKHGDEYRVMIFGDSSVWGTALFSNETLAGLINSKKLKTCDGKQVTAFNLGYPNNSALKDLVIMDRAQQYQPDLSVWLFSMLALAQDSQVSPFIDANPNYARNLIGTYNLDFDINKIAIQEDTFFDRTLIGRRQKLNLLVQYYASTIITAAVKTDDPRVTTDREEIESSNPRKTNDFVGILPPADLHHYLVFDTLRVANQITNGKILFVNEPIYISPDANDIAYNSLFPVWAYDQYRQILRELADERNYQFLDEWDIAMISNFQQASFI